MLVVMTMIVMMMIMIMIAAIMKVTVIGLGTKIVSVCGSDHYFL